MQTRPTTRLARILASAHRKKSFRQIAIQYQILTPGGHPDKGMVKRIIDGYEPKLPETRARLGLPPLPAVCPSCKRRIPHTHPKPEPIKIEDQSFDPTAPRPEFIRPGEPVRNPLSGFFRSVLTGRVVSARQWFQEKAELA
jgi:hypothetical protein